MKYLLLAKSNIKKTKGLTVGLLLLIAIAACFLNVLLLINFDFNKNAKNVAEKLNTEDVYLLISGDTSEITDTYLKNIDSTNIKDYEVNRIMTLISDLPFNNGIVTANVVLGSEDLFHNRIGKLEILKEDDSIHSNYVYVPYQFYTGGGFKLGDDFSFKVLDKNYSFKIKGFINTITLGSNNVGAYQLVIDDNSYYAMKNDANGLIDGIYAKYKINDNVNETKFSNTIFDIVSKDYQNISVQSMTVSDAITARTFLGTIFSALLLIVCAVVLVIVILMISNNISNFIRENIKTLGALKAMGYTTRDITCAFVSEFMIIDIVGCTIGVILSIFMMQLIGNIMVAQSAIPYHAKFILSTILITFGILLFVIFFSLLFLLRKTKKIEPIVALREGMTSKKVKKNVAPLEKTKLPLTLSLATKITFTNLSQNVVTAVIVFFLIIMSSISLVLFQTFYLKPKVSIMTFELCDGAITTDSDEEREIYHYLNNLKETKNVRLMAMNNMKVDDVQLMLYVIDGSDKFQNKDVVYKGKFPSNKNEIAVSGKFASVYGYHIGDNIEIHKGNSQGVFKITGFIQSLNNSGMESVLLKDGAEMIVGTKYDKMYYFDLQDDAKTDDVFQKVNDQFGSRIKSTIDFEDAMNGALGTFKVIAAAIVALVFLINVAIILLVLYMLIKTLINKKTKEYGILKAMGYTSKQIIVQNAISFLPAIMISVIISSIISCFTTNYIIGIVMNSFGIMKMTLDIPVGLITIMGIVLILLSLGIALLLSRKIKKIEPYKLLIGE